MALVAWAMGAVVAMATPPTDDALEKVRQRGLLRWCADVQGGEPYVFQDPANAERVVGFEVDIADAIAQRLGVRAAFVQNDWQHLIPALERGDCDVVLNGLEVTPARAQRVRLSSPYYRFRETIVVRRDDTTIDGLDDLRGRRVATLGGSLAHDLVAAAGAEVVLHEGVDEPYTDLERGRVDAVVLDDIIAERYGLVRPGLRLAATVTSGSYAAAVRPDDATLGGAIDDAIRGLRSSGELQGILVRWRLWNAHQETLREEAPSPGASGTVPSPRLTSSQVGLFLRGAAVTLVISVLAMLLAVGGGLGLTVARVFGGRPMVMSANAYVEIVRGTPVLLQLYVLYYGLAPFLTLDAFTAAVVGLGLNYAAYEAELYRAGVAAVPIGQTEAGLALGMSRWAVFRHVVLPQATRVALPGMANDFIALLKDTSLVSVITVVELTKQMTITAVDVRGWLVPGALCAALYLAMSLPLARLARRLERHLGHEEGT